MTTEISKHEKLQKLVDREVLYNESMLVDNLINIGKFSYEDVENYYPKVDREAPTLNCTTCGENVPVDENELCKNCQEPNEIFEWWRCTDWLITQLAKRGEPILRTEYGDYWGRTCTGQAIAMDSIMEEIYDETIGKYESQK